MKENKYKNIIFIFICVILITIFIGCEEPRQTIHYPRIIHVGTIEKIPVGGASFLYLKYNGINNFGNRFILWENEYPIAMKEIRYSVHDTWTGGYENLHFIVYEVTAEKILLKFKE
jgi:hypothetical protein